MKIIEGGICAVKDVLAAGACEDEYGVAVIICKDSNAAAVFTSNKVVAEPVKITREAIGNGKLSAIIANSGNANCFTGDQGFEDGKTMAREVADELLLDVNEVAVASTGIIGRKLPMNIIKPLIGKAIKRLDNSPKASTYSAEAIMTTDTFSKEFSVETELENGKKVRIGGITKGSGMIAPNMGTMLCFITTDVKASSNELKNALKKAVDKSFNMLVIDGDESTNDITLIMSNGKSGRIDEKFQHALDFVCIEMAKMMAKDGEGATKYLEVTVKGALEDKDAKNGAKAIVGSSLLKSALFGADPNWGRAIAALGYSGAKIDERKVDISFKSDNNHVEIVKNGKILALKGSKEIEIAEKMMKNDEINIIIDLNLGEYQATAFGCDLGYDYVKINSEYST